jgi:hypothetical protein
VFGSTGLERCDQAMTVAEDIGANLVVVGHRPDGPLARWWFSSVGTYLVKNLRCSVLIAQTEIGDEEFALPNPPFRNPALAAELTALSPDQVVAAGPKGRPRPEAIR